jgi:hypothetical protein
VIDIVGGVLVAVAYLGGWASARRGIKKPPREVCQCKHGSAFHDAKGCHIGVKSTVKSWTDPTFTAPRPLEWTYAECPCVRYVGPLSSYIPELDGHKET